MFQSLYAREQDTIRSSNAGQLASREMIALLAQSNQHVDNSGNFSIEVLRSAVNFPPHSLNLVSMAASDPAASGDITSYSGFIIHQSQHWFAVRKIHGYWWNLDSLLDYPQHISEFYLAAFINQQLYDGNLVFVATKSDSKMGPATLPIASRHSSVNNLNHDAMGSTSYHELSNLLRLNNVPVPMGGGSATGASNNATVFQGVGNRLGGATTSVSTDAAANYVDGDDDLRRAIALSLQDAESKSLSLTGADATHVGTGSSSQQTLTEKEKMREKRLAAMNNNNNTNR